MEIVHDSIDISSPRRLGSAQNIAPFSALEFESSFLLDLLHAPCNSDTMDPYSLVKLPSASTHTRLLHVAPSGKLDQGAHHAAPLVCTLEATEIDRPRRFKALSYVWGDQPQRERCWAFRALSYVWSGQSQRERCWAFLGNTQVPITRNLDVALRRFRHVSEPVTLWVDQLCINQLDSKEKSEQVSKMGNIYSKAEQVLVWLGPSADGSDAVMDAFANFGQEAESLNMMSYYTPERLPILLRMLFEPMPESPDREFRAFRELQRRASSVRNGIRHSLAAWFQRKYFTRVWVVQEFAVGADAVFICGDKVVARRHVLMAIYILESSINHMERAESDMPQDFDIQDTTTAFFRAWKRWERAGGDELFNLLRATFTHNSMHASDGRDRVYALLGLAVDVGDDRLDIKPDYGNSSFKSVMTQAAGAIIRSGRVALLSYSQHPKDSELPSWVPDWRPTLRPSYYTDIENATPQNATPQNATSQNTTPQNATPQNATTQNQEPRFSASGSTSVVIVPTQDPDILGLEGFRIDTVERVGDLRWDEDWKHAGFAAHLKQVDDFCQLSAAKAHHIYSSPSRRAEAVWRLPIADTYRHNGVHNRASSGMEEAYTWFVIRNDTLNNLESNPDQEFNRENFSRIMEWGRPYHSSLQNTTRLRLYMTTKGFLGLADPMVEPGDILVVFKGAKIPYVLRPKDMSAREFTFVGDAYCDGMMDGEVLENGTAAPFFLI